MYRTDEPSPRAVDGPSLMSLAAPSSADLDGIGEADDALFAPQRDRLVRAGRRNLHEKLMAGLVGIKHAVRGDSSFFAHAYRALLVFLTAGMIGVSPAGWLVLVLSLGLVLIAELMHSAVDTLARAIGDPEEPQLRVARDIAAAGVLVSVVISALVSLTVLILKLGEYLGWWDRVPW
jgi:diacylglycerol kinase (ATP)